jgi:AcrR family transcriptional regulator
MKSEDTKEAIIAETMRIIGLSDGRVEDVTIRAIAQGAGVGVGLVNHYFGTKERLIELCVQRMIRDVVGTFRVEPQEGDTPLFVTQRVAKQVMDFLMAHPEVSAISILGDLKQPRSDDNTMGTVWGFSMCMSGGKEPERYTGRAFALTSLLQEAFLRRDVMKTSLGVDFYEKKQRDRFLDEAVTMVMEAV